MSKPSVQVFRCKFCHVPVGGWYAFIAHGLACSKRPKQEGSQ